MRRGPARATPAGAARCGCWPAAPIPTGPAPRAPNGGSSSCRATASWRSFPATAAPAEQGLRRDAVIPRAGRGRMALVYSAAPTAGNRRTMPSSAAPRAIIALAAGGTGGHLFPAEALARELLARGYGVVIHTERRGAQYSQALEGLEHVVLPASSLEGGLVAKLRAALTIARGVLASRRDL